MSDQYTRKPGDMIAIYRGIIEINHEKARNLLDSIDRMIVAETDLSDSEKKEMLEKNASFKHGIAKLQPFETSQAEQIQFLEKQLTTMRRDVAETRMAMESRLALEFKAQMRFRDEAAKATALCERTIDERNELNKELEAAKIRILELENLTR